MAAPRILYVDCEADRTLEQAGFSAAAMFSRSAAEAHFERHAAQQRMMVTLCVTRWSDADTCTVHAPHSGRGGGGGAAELPGAARGARRLIAQLDEAPAICAWNAGWVLGTLAKYAPAGGGLHAARWRDKAMDPMVALRDPRSGQWPSLHSVAAPAAGLGGRGAEAVALHEAGQLAQLATHLRRDVALLQGVSEALLAGAAVRAPVSAALLPGAWQTPCSRTVSTQTTAQAPVRR
jgi:hypothetical protein